MVTTNGKSLPKYYNMTTVDPKILSMLSSNIALNDAFGKSKFTDNKTAMLHYITSRNKDKAKMQYFSSRYNKAMEAELPKDFYKVGMDINSDGKMTYYG
jgi:predicted lipase